MQRDLIASVQYNDYTGTAAADNNDHRRIDDLAERLGVDTERYFILGFEFSVGEISDEVEPLFVTLFAVDTQKTKIKNMDELQRFTDAHGGKVPIVHIHLEADINDVLLSLKRLNVVLISRYLERVSAFQHEADISLPLGR